jgi:DUF1009 family protein
VNKIGLIAGNGVFPLEVARAARRRGLAVIAIAHSGETDPALSTLADEITWIKIGELQRMIEVFRSAGVKNAAMAGGITRARLADSFAPDARAMAMLSRIGRFGDDSILRAVASEIESEGISVIDPVPMLDNILADPGLGAGPAPSAAQLEDLQVAFEILRSVGRFDIGQVVAIRDGVVGAVEAVEGTDAALRRAATLLGRGLVIAKAAKSSQDLRFDRPAIGVATIELLSDIGAALIGVEAGKAMILERQRTVERANALGVAVYGYE